MDACGRLEVVLWIEVRVDDHCSVGGHEVEPEAAGARREEECERRVVCSRAEAANRQVPFFGANRSVQPLVVVS